MNTPFALILALLVFLLAGCTTMLTPAQSPAPAGKTIRFLALGDSYTIGESEGESQRWPVQLSGLLEQRGVKVDVSIIARTGWTTDELWQAIQQVNPPGTYELVSLLIGVNDEFRGGAVDLYRQDFHFLLGKAIAYAGGDPKRVIVLSIPDWGITPYAQNDPRPAAQIGAEIDAFNAVNSDEAQKAGVHYVDVIPVSRSAAADPALLAADGLHPSGKMYAAWAELALPGALSALGISP
jgi:lysophospholipase L1-like esterase